MTEQKKQEMALAIVPRTVDEVYRLGRILADSGFFGIATSEQSHATLAAQAVVKVMRGAEMGIGPMTSVMGMHVIEGKPTLGAGLLAARLRSTPGYDYEVTEHTAEACTIVVSRHGKKCTPYRVTYAECEKRGITKGKGGSTKANWERHPESMLFARAISGAVRTHAPEVTMGPVYETSEMRDGEIPEEVITVEARVLEPTAAQAALPEPVPPAGAVGAPNPGRSTVEELVEGIREATASLPQDARDAAEGLIVRADGDPVKLGSALGWAQRLRGTHEGRRQQADADRIAHGLKVHQGGEEGPPDEDRPPEEGQPPEEELDQEAPLAAELPDQRPSTSTPTAPDTRSAAASTTPSPRAGAAPTGGSTGGSNSTPAPAQPAPARAPAAAPQPRPGRPAFGVPR